MTINRNFPRRNGAYRVNPEQYKTNEKRGLIGYNQERFKTKRYCFQGSIITKILAYEDVLATSMISLRVLQSMVPLVGN